MRFKNKKVIVTGGLGFIGSHLVNALIDEGADVLLIDNLSSGYAENKDKRMPNDQALIGDFTDFNYLLKVFKQFEPEYVFHIGAWGRMPMCMEDPIGAYKNNVMGTINVLEASRQVKVKKVVLSSSCIVYCQDTPYKGTKTALEHLSKIYYNSYDLSTISLRYGNVYGERQKVGMDSAMFAMFKDSMKTTSRLKIFGDGEQTRDWINVKDICEANMLSALSYETGAMDICTGNSISLNYIVKDVLNLPFEHIEQRKGDEKHIALDPRRAKERINFKSQIKFEDGIKKVWENL